MTSRPWKPTGTRLQLMRRVVRQRRTSLRTREGQIDNPLPMGSSATADSLASTVAYVQQLGEPMS